MSDSLKPVVTATDEPKNKSEIVVFDDAPESGLPRPSDKPYNPNKDREYVRSTVAYGLLVLLIVTVVSSFICLSFKWMAKDDLKDLLTIVFGPIITLLGAVTGFYYGEKSNNN